MENKSEDTLFYEKVSKQLKNITEVKNYKELCIILNEKITTGNAKIKQMQKWKEFFSYQNVGQKFTSIHVLTEQERQQIIQNKLFDDSMCYCFLSLLLSYYNQKHIQTLVVTDKDLAILLGLIKSDFRFYETRKGELSYDIETKLLSSRSTELKQYKQQIKEQRKEDKDYKKKYSTKITLTETQDFYDHVPATYSRRISNMIEKMKQDKTFYVSNTLFGGFRKRQVVINKSTNKFGDDIFNTSDSYTIYERELTLKEREQYINLKTQALKDVDCISFNEVYKQSKVKEYNTVLKKLIKESKIGAEYIYDSYVFSFSPEYIEINQDITLNQLIKNNTEFIKDISGNKYKRIQNNPMTQFLPSQRKLQEVINNELVARLLSLNVDLSSQNIDWIFNKSSSRYSAILCNSIKDKNEFVNENKLKNNDLDIIVEEN